jgi:hypothetical protein
VLPVALLISLNPALVEVVDDCHWIEPVELPSVSTVLLLPLQTVVVAGVMDPATDSALTVTLTVLFADIVLKHPLASLLPDESLLMVMVAVPEVPIEEVEKVPVPELAVIVVVALLTVTAPEILYVTV